MDIWFSTIALNINIALSNSTNMKYEVIKDFN